MAWYYTATWGDNITSIKWDKKQEVKMKELIKRAFDLKYCIAVKRVYGCRLCPYYENGCRYTPMLDAAKVIERMIEEICHE